MSRAGSSNAKIEFNRGSSGGDGSLTFSTAATDRLNISSGGDISFYEDTGTTPKFFWDASAEALGIGTSSPQDTGVGYSNLTVNGTTGGVIDLTDDNVRVGSFFNTANDVSLGNFTATGFLGFRTNSTERMRIDSSGNLLVGKTSPSTGTAGGEIRSDGLVVGVRSSNNAAVFGRNTSDGEIVGFRKDGGAVGSIGVNSSNNLRIASTAASHSGIEFSTNQILPLSANVFSDATENIGSSSFRFKDLYLSGGVVETTTTISGTSVSLTYNNGSVQTHTLSGNTTYTDSLADGEAIVLMLNGGASYTVTWPTLTWVTSGGNVAPTLTANDTVVLWKIGSTLYAAYAGSYV
jgi:hypothetical protein